MARQRTPTVQEVMRLDAIAQHLKVKSWYGQPSFKADVITACLARIAPVVDKLLPCTGEKIAQCLADHLCLTFEEVHGPRDVEDLECRYLKGKKEIGFAQLRKELNRPGVEALLFERMYAQERDPDRWVAVLNLQETDAKGYWDRFHELAHRITEPPQWILPFLRRDQMEAGNPVETLIDAVAAEFAFYGPAVRPIVERLARESTLDFDIVETLRTAYAPSASLLSTMKAVVKYWPHPAAALTAEFRGRVNAPDVDQALRVTVQGRNAKAASADLSFIPNMRVPAGTPIDIAFETGLPQDESENLDTWTTSQGKRLTPLEVYTSARRLGSAVYALISQ